MLVSFLFQLETREDSSVNEALAILLMSGTYCSWLSFTSQEGHGLDSQVMSCDSLECSELVDE